MLRVIALAVILAATPAFAKSCDRMKEEDYKAMNSATSRLHSACKADAMSHRCTLAIEAGSKALAASNRLALECPAVTWSYDPPPPWSPDAQ